MLMMVKITKNMMLTMEMNIMIVIVSTMKLIMVTMMMKKTNVLMIPTMMPTMIRRSLNWCKALSCAKLKRKPEQGIPPEPMPVPNPGLRPKETTRKKAWAKS